MSLKVASVLAGPCEAPSARELRLGRRIGAEVVDTVSKQPSALEPRILVPEFGLSTRPGYAIDFIRQVHPKQASPVHGTGSPFVRLPKGTHIEV